MGLHLNILPPTYRYIVVGIIILVAIVVRGSQFFSTKGRLNTPLGAPRDYGIGGGTVCPRCHRPFPLSLFSLKMGIGTKLVRCPYCQKWSLVHRLSPAELRAAEAAELADAQTGQAIREKSEAEKTQELLNESRFTDKM